MIIVALGGQEHVGSLYHSIFIDAKIFKIKKFKKRPSHTQKDFQFQLTDGEKWKEHSSHHYNKKKAGQTAN